MDQCFGFIRTALENLTIFSSMPVIPCCPSLLQNRKDLYQLLCHYQQKSVKNYSDQIVSIASEIDCIDPLAVLQELSIPDQPHFYLEKSFEDEAIAAIGAVTSSEVEGGERFSQTQTFINSCLEALTLTGATVLPNSAPRFFCSFTFFEQNAGNHTRFSAATVFLPRWQVLRQRDRCVAIANLFINEKSDLTALTDSICQQFQTIQLAKYGIFNLPDSIRQKLNQWEIIDTNSFKPAVDSALDLIAKNKLSKLVIADAVDVISQLPFQWIQSLQHLRQRHPDCYVFSTSSGRGQSFIGASPERLMRIDQHLLSTDALAGSAARGKTVGEDVALAKRLLNSEKEQREHQVVVDFIQKRLAHFGMVPRLASAPRLLKLSNIQHLHTPIQARMPRHLQPLTVLAELHPTPAVAGMPRAIACEQIRYLEAFERSLYAAPLGWIDTEGNAEFIVGIRSAAIQGCHARLYAGAGIVAGSNPDRELAEVRLKLQTLLQALV
jgi:menaquinone-specific isochorismate synthase